MLVGLGIVFFMSQGIDMSVFALNIVSLLGIGIGIDYSLFYTSRFQEELREGKSVEDAVLGANSHAGQAILFSAVTSLIGLISLIAFPVMMLRSVMVATMTSTWKMVTISLSMDQVSIESKASLVLTGLVFKTIDSGFTWIWT